ncbi:transcription factor IIIB 90 kDa subunit [Diabrotica virgifera virgifera]|uniref:B-related factor 1 n=1 Tax=Diabrotica virgifera virgifera TaxID=50390 RepID=A0A6P7FFB8_DIAVI|nr:transcription factor IIIB 90 kDa subunit [Diabrotica virgifera virgifera]
MSSGRKCKNCGGSDIEVDPARGDAVCTTCGSVLEDSIIVAEIQFEEGAHGSTSAIGQFVAADSKGGATKFGASFHVGDSVESREITLKKARNGITHLCNQLRLNQHCIDTACSFFKMALSRNLTRGRRNTHVHAACVYLTCRTEGTAHLLIDISDVLQICCYELGRTYLRLSQALCINIPSVDPCLYILRFASKMQFGTKTQQVANTALRLVQRMKRDSIHSGRRPSGLCGAALLMASRLHEFNRSPGDIVKIVKVHESTLRKRLMEFRETPSSALTLEEFMTVDLEEEQDPPSFKTARRKDKERLLKLSEEDVEHFTDLQKEIELQLENKRKSLLLPKKSRPKVDEELETDKFINESTLGTIKNIIHHVTDTPEPEKGLGPDISSIGLPNSLEDTSNAYQPPEQLQLDMNFDDLDDDELDTYIMTDNEVHNKKTMWYRRNATYLEEQKIKAEKMQKEREEGKPEKKRKRTTRKKTVGPANSAGEAIEKILQEKKVSTKINYDVLKSLNVATIQNDAVIVDEEDSATTSESIKRRRLSSVSNYIEQAPEKTSKRKIGTTVGLPVFEEIKTKTENSAKNVVPTESAKKEDISEEEEEYYDEEQVEGGEEPNNEMGVLQMLRQHREDEDEADYGYNYFEEADY